MKYEEPNIEIMKLEMRDVIRTSPEFGSNTDIGGGDDDGGFARQ